MSDFKIDIKIEAQKLVEDLKGLGDNIIKQLQNQVNVFSKAVYAEGVRLAAQRLHSSYPVWVENFKFEQEGKDVYIIYLDDNSKAPAFEEGFNPFDMKIGFLRSPKCKEARDGSLYFDVPFNIKPTSKTPASPKIIDMRSAVAAVLKDESINKIIKKYNASSTGLNRFGDVTKYPNISDPKVQGLVKITPPGKQQGKYFLFRRVSKNSNPTKFIHPGYQGAHIFTDLEEYTQKGINDLINKILK